MFTLGFAQPAGAVPAVIVFLAAATGLVIVTLQIAYLPALYAAFNRRETEVALLNARGGFPSWGPELLARTHYALGSGMSTLDTMPDLYAQWERWAADVSESHTTYLPLVRFRSPQALSSWVTSLLAVLDSAAMFLALSPKAAPVIPARLCLRSGFLCFNRIARAMGFSIPDEPGPGAGTSLTYDEFLDAVARLREVDFPIERDPEQAWPEFVGWRVNYEQAAYAVAAAVYAVPALWSGPRRHPVSPIPPHPPGTRPPSQVGQPVVFSEKTNGWRGPLPCGDQPFSDRERRPRKRMIMTVIMLGRDGRAARQTDSRERSPARAVRCPPRALAADRVITRCITRSLALIGACSARSASGIRNRALIAPGASCCSPAP
jgi:hypothetical protein